MTKVYVVTVGAYEGDVDSVHATFVSAMRRKRALIRQYVDGGDEVIVTEHEVIGAAGRRADGGQ
jgi:hypothetical protein